jgi:hypothetical protein
MKIHNMTPKQENAKEIQPETNITLTARTTCARKDKSLKKTQLL